MRKNTKGICLKAACMAAAMMLGLAACDGGSETKGASQPAAIESADTETATSESTAEKTSEESTSGETSSDEGSGEASAENVQTQSSESVIGKSGFLLKSTDSFASRAEGTYLLNPDLEDEEELKEYLELYSIGDNLYGFYNGDATGFTAIEFFPETEGGFASKDDLSVRAVQKCFSIQSNAGLYWSDEATGVTITLTEDGIRFSDVDDGENIAFEATEGKRLDTEMGELESFAYRDADKYLDDLIAGMDVEKTELPAEMIGLWRILGSTDYAPFLELTEDGLVQYYLKTNGSEVVLYRGRYVTVKDSHQDGQRILMVMIGLGMSGQPRELQIGCYLQDGTIRCYASDDDVADNLFWDGACLLRVTPDQIPDASPDGVTVSAGTFKELEGKYASQTGYIMLISEEGYYYIYDNVDFSQAMLLDEGYLEETPGSLIMYAYDYADTGEKKSNGFIALMSPGELSVTNQYVSDGSMTFELHE